VSGVVKRLDEQLSQFAQRRLEEAFAYVILDARYEKVRESGSIRSRAVLVAIGIDWEGRRQVLGVELANRESASSWKDFLLCLRQRGLKGVELVVSDDHAGLPRCCLNRSGSDVMCISFAMPWITCPAREMTIACGSCAGSMTAGM
jgi:transposase-like protein